MCQDNSTIKQAGIVNKLRTFACCRCSGTGKVGISYYDTMTCPSCRGNRHIIKVRIVSNHNILHDRT